MAAAEPFRARLLRSSQPGTGGAAGWPGGFDLHTTSYRDSHLTRGHDYHAIFTTRPHTRMLWNLERRVLDHVLATRFDAGPPRHLDFACGTGRVLAHLAGRTARSVGVDVSESMLAVAREVAPHADLRRLDLTRERLPEGERFDLVTAFRFFPRAEPELREAAMAALAGLLAPGGLVVFNNHLNNTSVMRWLSRHLGHGRQKGMSHDEALALAVRHGLTVAGCWPLGLLPFNDRVIPARALVRKVEWFAAQSFHLPRLAQDVVYVARRE